MSQAALLCLLYLVLLTAATIHLYLVADAPNHSILPLIYLNTTPLEYSLCPSRHVFCWSIYPSVFPFIPQSRCAFFCLFILIFTPLIFTCTFILFSICPSVGPSVCPSIYQTIQSCVNKILLWKIWRIQQYCSDLICQLVAVGKSLACYLSAFCQKKPHSMTSVGSWMLYVWHLTECTTCKDNYCSS